jgi:hypothetical protein
MSETFLPSNKNWAQGLRKRKRQKKEREKGRERERVKEKGEKIIVSEANWFHCLSVRRQRKKFLTVSASRKYVKTTEYAVVNFFHLHGGHQESLSIVILCLSELRRAVIVVCSSRIQVVQQYRLLMNWEKTSVRWRMEYTVITWLGRGHSGMTRTTITMDSFSTISSGTAMIQIWSCI